MIKKLMACMTFLILFSLCCLVLAPSSVYAHSTSLVGLFEGTRTNIGHEDTGWYVDESQHWNKGTTIEYYIQEDEGFFNYLTPDQQQIVKEGAGAWKNIITITRVDDNHCKGKIITEYLGKNAANAYCEAPGLGSVAEVDANGHRTVWRICINLDLEFPPKRIIAHEFGHLLGLNHVTAEKNKYKLMYPVPTAATPTSADSWGAKVILGMHTSHSWGSQGLYHACKYCGGRKLHKPTSAKPIRYDSVYHQLTCSVCSFDYFDKHSGNWKPYNSTKHKRVCACGVISYENHVNNLGRCKVCGYTGGTTIDRDTSPIM